MTGRVDESLRALVDLAIHRTQSEAPTIVTAWVDTAFNGFLVFPQRLIETLNLEQEAVTEAILADGSRVTLESFACFVDWFGESIRAQVIGNNGKLPLLGTELLARRKLLVDYAVGLFRLTEHPQTRKPPQSLPLPEFTGRFRLVLDPVNQLPDASGIYHLFENQKLLTVRSTEHPPPWHRAAPQPQTPQGRHREAQENQAGGLAGKLRGVQRFHAVAGGGGEDCEGEEADFQRAANCGVSIAYPNYRRAVPR